MSTKAEQVAAVGAQYCIIKNRIVAMVLPCGNMQIVMPAKMGPGDASVLKQWIIDNFETNQ